MPAMNDNGVCLTLRSVCIAGKRAPTEKHRIPLWEQSLLAMNDDAVALMNRSALIAGKHRSHRKHRIPL